MTTWRELITETMKENGDTWEDVIDFKLSKGGYKWDDNDDDKKEPSLDDDFYSGFGGEEGCSFQLWTKSNVYFPICYDGSEWCGSASRNPNGKALRHQGG